MKYFINHGACPSHLGPRERRALRFQSAQYSLINDVFFRKNYDGVLLRCLEKDDAEKVLKDLHDGPAGGHFSGDTTAHKVLRAGSYWPTLLKDAHAHARKCQICQFGAGREKKAAVPLQPVTIDRPFQQWGIDVIGEINPHSSKQHKYIITATDYFTRWTEAIPATQVNDKVVIQFL